MSDLTVTTSTNYPFISEMFRVSRKERLKSDPSDLNSTFLKAVGLEGASRAGKSWDICVFICDYLDTFQNKVINIFRGALSTLRLSTFETLKKVFTAFKMPTSQFNKTTKKITYNKNTINFIGANDDLEKLKGIEGDISWVNECFEVAKESFLQILQRTSEFLILDYNPSAVDIYLYDLELREDYRLHKTTIFDNPYAPISEKQQILSYAHPDSGDNDIAEKAGYSIKEWLTFKEGNVLRGTANLFMWQVYGLGKRSVSEDIIFNNWELYTEEPKGYEWKLYGGDWGYSQDPTVLVQVKKDGNNIYVKELIYEKGLLNQDIANLMIANNWIDEVSMWDSSEPKSIAELQVNNIPADGAQKGDGSIIWGIQNIQAHKVFIHATSENVINEFKKYTWAKRPNGEYKRNTKGKRMPVDKYNHSIDAIRYALSRYLEPVTNEH
jgi:phage terminase large subunit